MDLREEYEKHLAAQAAAPELTAAADSLRSTTSDRARASRTRNQADPERMARKVAEFQAAEQRSIDRALPPDMQQAVMALIQRGGMALLRQEIKNLLPHPLRGLVDNYTNDPAPLAAMMDATGQAYWGPAAGGFIYSSYFRVADASTTVGDSYTPIIKVIDGHLPDSPVAGPASVNGVFVEGGVFTETLELEINTDYNIWAQCYLGEADIVVVNFIFTKINEAVKDYVDGFPCSNILLARVFVGEESLSINQEHFGSIYAFLPVDIWSGHVIFCGEDGGKVKLGGETLYVDIVTGDTAWDRQDMDENIEVNEYEVGVLVPDSDPPEFRPRHGRVVGDIRIDLAPYWAPYEA